MIREVIYDDDGQPIAATCVDQPLSDEARGHLAELVKFARAHHQRQDPHGLQGDKQRRSLDRLYKRTTPPCPHAGCGRVDQHDGPCLPPEECTP